MNPTIEPASRECAKKEFKNVPYQHGFDAPEQRGYYVQLLVNKARAAVWREATKLIEIEAHNYTGQSIQCRPSVALQAVANVFGQKAQQCEKGES